MPAPTSIPIPAPFDSVENERIKIAIRGIHRATGQWPWSLFPTVFPAPDKCGQTMAEKLRRVVELVAKPTSNVTLGALDEHLRSLVKAHKRWNMTDKLGLADCVKAEAWVNGQDEGTGGSGDGETDTEPNNRQDANHRIINDDDDDAPDDTGIVHSHSAKPTARSSGHKRSRSISASPANQRAPKRNAGSTRAERQISTFPGQPQQNNTPNDTGPGRDKEANNNVSRDKDGDKGETGAHSLNGENPVLAALEADIESNQAEMAQLTNQILNHRQTLGSVDIEAAEKEVELAIQRLQNTASRLASTEDMLTQLLDWIKAYDSDCPDSVRAGVKPCEAKRDAARKDWEDAEKDVAAKEERLEKDRRSLESAQTAIDASNAHLARLKEQIGKDKRRKNVFVLWRNLVDLAKLSPADLESWPEDDVATLREMTDKRLGREQREEAP
ncbi:hypothetical protein NM208_g171 [Fusarium decemcellulare]|uniref:Uncharacterized protein n=1 Tax=Fusarium decemcellulare TaxID=57161 RepID=A0ACC1T0P2_9HYPO|nr:hypothetical protein NM208_g171 [Fusarium decemcellulare]